MMQPADFRALLDLAAVGYCQAHTPEDDGPATPLELLARSDSGVAMAYEAMAKAADALASLLPPALPLPVPGTFWASNATRDVVEVRTATLTATQYVHLVDATTKVSMPTNAFHRSFTQVLPRS